MSLTRDQIVVGLHVKCTCQNYNGNNEYYDKIGTITSIDYINGFIDKFYVKWDVGNDHEYELDVMFYCSSSFVLAENKSVLSRTQDCSTCSRTNDCGVKICWYCGNNPSTT